MKFNIGDIVKIKEGLNSVDTDNFVIEMGEYCGKKAKIVDIINPYYKLDIDNEKWYWSEEILERCKEEYHIIINGNTVIVRDNDGNEGESDLSTSISNAIDKLKWKPKKEEFYWTVDLTIDTNTISFEWGDDNTDNELYKKGLVFKTEEEAKRTADKMLGVV